MKTINETTFFNEIRICKYELCNKEFTPKRKDKVFCCRECKMKNRLRNNYWKLKEERNNI